MKRFARPSMAYGAALAAGCIALVSALGAWAQFQERESSITVVTDLILAAGAALFVPLVVVTSLIGATALVRRLASRARRGSDGTASASEPAGTPRPSSTLEHLADR